MISFTDEEISEKLKKVGFTLIEMYFLNNLKKVILESSDGYLYDVLLFNALRHPSLNIVHPSNPFSLRNISNWIEIKNFDFELCPNQKYVNAKTKLVFKCFKCGDSFSVDWSNLSNKTFSGCSICESSGNKQVGKFNNLKYLNPEILLDWNYEKNKIHPEELTVSSGKKVFWKCRDCSHEWETALNSRTSTSKTSCPNCSGRIVSEKNSLSAVFPNICEEWDYSKNNHINPCDFSFGSQVKVFWKCQNCGQSWKCSIASRTSMKTGCPHCSYSKGQTKISEFLNSISLKEYSDYFQEYRFDSCKNMKTLPFDFYIPKLNLCIEYNGEQHYRPVQFGGMPIEKAKDRFVSQKNRDGIKKKYCYENNLSLLIIPYWEKDNIENILSLEINKILGGI
jgi:DNA-directed RNA polymerase subunit RPC12/RpoP